MVIYTACLVHDVGDEKYRKPEAGAGPEAREHWENDPEASHRRPMMSMKRIASASATREWTFSLAASVRHKSLPKSNTSRHMSHTRANPKFHRRCTKR